MSFEQSKRGEPPGPPRDGAVNDEGGDPSLDRAIQSALRARRYSPRTVKAYSAWARRFVLFCEVHDRKQLERLTSADLVRYLSHLAVGEQVSPSTQRQALAALSFLFDKILGQRSLAEQVAELRLFVPAPDVRSRPFVLKEEEAEHLLENIAGPPHLMASLLYRSGLRLMECCRLRIRDLDLDRREIVVGRGKATGGRVVPLPRELLAELERHLTSVRHQHERDVAEGAGWVEVPTSGEVAAKDSARSWSWQWVFPATRVYLEEKSGTLRRHHLHQTVLQKAVSRASLAAGLSRRVTCSCLRDSSAARLLGVGTEHNHPLTCEINLPVR